MSSVTAPEPHASPDYSIANANPPRPSITRVLVHPPPAPSVPVDRRTGFAATEPTEQQPVFSGNNNGLGKKYTYSPLPPRNIRLLHLMPYDGDGDSIRCQLFEYPIQETWERADVYEALSYFWGGSDKPCSISIGECYLPVTANLHAALLRLQHRLIGRVIWVDAVCINQEDKEEQAQQVRSMAEIYFKASRVIVWLGEAEAEDHDTLKAICAPCHESKSSSGINLRPAAVLALFARPWFRRIWVLQEVAAARHVRIMCGSMEVEGYALCLGLEARPDLPNPIRPMTYLMTQSVFRPEYTIGHSGEFSLGIRPLSELIDMYHDYEATVRHDKVFALLGMSSDAPNALEHARLLPNYGISWAKLLKQLVKFFLGGQVSVYPHPNRVVTVIKGKGYVLGKVVSVNGRRVCITLETSDLPREWTLQPSAKSVHVDDIVCLLHGASKPTIIRPCKDYFSVILICVTPPDNTEAESKGDGLRNMRPSLPNDFLLVWAWEGSQNGSPDEEYASVIKIGGNKHLNEGGAVQLAKAIRLRNAALILRNAELHDAAEQRFREMEGSCGNGVSELYDHMMTAIEKKQMPDPEHCKTVLLAVSLARRPLSVPELTVVAGLPLNIDPVSIVEKCQFFHVTKDGEVHLMHPSIKGYLEKNFASKLQPAGIPQRYVDIGRRSIDAMSLLLRQNMYSLDFGYKPDDIALHHPDPLASIRYSCEFWADHLCFMNGENSECSNELTENRKVLKFLREHLLHWLEALSLMGKLSDGVTSIRQLLAAQLRTDIAPDLVRFLKDAEKFVLSHGLIMERAPLQIYSSALVFSPTLSEVKEQFWKERLSFIRSAAGIRDRWGAHQQTLERHSSWVYAVAFSPDGRTVASGSNDKTIRLWDTATGAHQQTLEGHSGPVYAVAFSPDGRTVASGSNDKTIRLWDTATGAHQQTLEGHSGPVYAVAFSPDGRTVASGSYDKTIRLWDTATGAHQQTLEEHSGPINAVAFSPDGRTVASGSYDKTIRLWDTATGAHQQTLERYNIITTLSFSANGQYLETNRGIVKINPDVDISNATAASGTSGCSGVLDTSSTKPSGNIFVDGDWITRNGKRLLWLPPDYRAHCVSVYNHTMVLGHASGQVTFLQFSSD